MRRCEFCERPLGDQRRAHARYCDGLCRAAASRQRREESAQKRTHATTRQRSGPSGLQVSYQKALASVWEEVCLRLGTSTFDTYYAVEIGLRKALSPAQRARLEARS